MLKHFKWFVLVVLGALSIFMLNACGGGGSGGSTPQTITLSGTAAEGKPIANATVVLRDADGVTDNITTDDNGSYQVTVTMKSPILLKVIGSDNKTYYSIATKEGIEKGTINIHPYTDLIIRHWYEVNGIDIDKEFDNVAKFPSADDIDAIKGVVKDIISQFLVSFIKDSSNFDIISTPFKPDGTGFDGILDIVKVKQEGNNLTIVVEDNKTKGDDVIATLTPKMSIQQMADIKPAINERLSEFKDIINNNGCGTTVNDIKDFFDTDFIWQGMTPEILLAQIKTFGLGCDNDTDTPKGQIDKLELVSLDKIQNEGNDIVATVKLQRTVNNETTWVKFPLHLKLVDGNWKLTGDNMPAYATFRISYEKQYRANSTAIDTRKRIKIRVYDRLDNVAKVEVSGPGIDGTKELYKYCELSNDNQSSPTYQGNCYDDGFSAREFKGSFFWVTGGAPIDNESTFLLNEPPYSGAIYTLTLYSKDNNAYSDNVTILPFPEQFEYPEFRNINTHSLTFTDGKMEITGEAYTPSFVWETSAPFVELWDGDGYDNGSWGNEIGDVDCKWDSTPIPGQYNSFSCSIPENMGSDNVTIAILGQDASASDFGGTQLNVYWDFVK
jgi:hypothetical protein